MAYRLAFAMFVAAVAAALPPAEQSLGAGSKADAKMTVCRRQFGPTVYKYEILKNGALRCYYRVQPRTAAEAREACNKLNLQGHHMVTVRRYVDGTWACMVK